MVKTLKLKSEKSRNSAHGVDIHNIPIDDYLIFIICIILAAFAFYLDSPSEILSGLHRINTSRSVLITDYVALAGIGATLINSALQVFLTLILIITTKTKLTGRVIAAIFLTAGFSLFGKNIFNTLPIIGGVWLYGKATKTDFRFLVLQAMIAGTIAPIVSEIAFFGEFTSPLKILVAYLVGIFIGFIFPVVLEKTVPIHKNYCLYKGGIAGGFIAVMFAGLFRSFGFKINPEYYWDMAHTMPLSVLSYSIAAALILFGLIADNPKNTFRKLISLTKERDTSDSDFFRTYKYTAYVNIGILCALATTVMLLLGKPINGPILGGIFTISGFAAAGKNLRNVVPILLGSIFAAHINFLDVGDPQNALAILFSTGLAPIAGKYGWIWGIITGFTHVSVAIFVGDINGGLNLYNNGFAGAFVVVIIIPIIGFINSTFAKTKTRIEEEFHLG
jgi:hypothetical protein